VPVGDGRVEAEQAGCLRVGFTLPSGAYATVVVEALGVPIAPQRNES